MFRQDFYLRCKFSWNFLKLSHWDSLNIYKSPFCLPSNCTRSRHKTEINGWPEIYDDVGRPDVSLCRLRTSYHWNVSVASPAASTSSLSSPLKTMLITDPRWRPSLLESGNPQSQVRHRRFKRGILFLSSQRGTGRNWPTSTSQIFSGTWWKTQRGESPATSRRRENRLCFEN